MNDDGLVKEGHLLRCPPSSSLDVRPKYASLLGMSDALHLTLFDQPEDAPLSILVGT
jgi:hypothetical protein